MIHLSIFADEISPDLQEQIALMQSEGLKYMVLRGIQDINVLDLSDAQIDDAKRALGAAGIKVSAIGSPIGKVPIDASFDEHLHRFERAITVALRLDAPAIRIFSFYPPAASGEGFAEIGDWSAFRPEVLRRLHELAVRARAAGVALVHENEKDIYGDTIARCVDLMQDLAPDIDSTNRFGFAFDPANFIQCQQTPFPDGYDALRNWVRTVHVKDARQDGTVVPAGEGAANWPRFLDALRADGYDGFFEVEPHLAQAGRFSGFSGPDLARVAIRALKGLLDEMAWPYNK